MSLREVKFEVKSEVEIEEENKGYRLIAEEWKCLRSRSQGYQEFGIV